MRIFTEEFEIEVKEWIRSCIEDQFGSLQDLVQTELKDHIWHVNNRISKISEVPTMFEKLLNKYHPALELLKELDETFDLAHAEKEEVERALNNANKRIEFEQGKVFRLQNQLAQLMRQQKNAVKME